MLRLNKYLGQSVSFQFIQAGQQLESQLNEKLQEFEMNYLQALVLLSLFFEGREVQPTELHALFFTTKGNISHTLSRLESLGLLKRLASKEDRRITLVRLSAKGQRVAPKLVKIFDQEQREIEQRFNQRKLNVLLKFVRSVLNGE